MNKVTTINLNGRAYQLEEGGEQVLRRYLETAAAKLAGNPDKDEIMADFEQAIADKFDQKLNGHKNVVTEREIEEIIAAMGPVDAAGAEAEAEANAGAGYGTGAASGSSNPDGKSSTGNPGAPKRLYRIPGGEWIMGVCNGLAAYFNVDVTLMRIIWILLAFITHGFWIAAYIVLAIVMPPAKTEEEYMQAHGWTNRPPFNAHDFIEETKKKYAELQKMHEEHKAQVAAAKAVGGDINTAVKGTKEEMKAWAKKMKMEMKQKKQQMKHEWRQERREWHHDWQQNRGDERNAYMNNTGAGYDISRAIYGFFAVIVSIVLLALAVAWFITLITFIKYGTVFGYVIGIGQPLWIGIVFLCAAFYIITIPFRLLLQRAWGHARYRSGWQEFGQAIVFIIVCGVFIYTARELFPQVNDFWNANMAWLGMRR
jgi:phage shock protein PspC (stress-responsive transcriptional regulator)